MLPSDDVQWAGRFQLSIRGTLFDGHGNPVSGIKALVGIVRQARCLSPFVWLILSALLFLLGAASFSASGSRTIAEVGVLGAIAAVAVIAAFRG